MQPLIDTVLLDGMAPRLEASITPYTMRSCIASSSLTLPIFRTSAGRARTTTQAVRSRHLHASTPLTPDEQVIGQDIPSRLIGTREEIDRKRAEFENKYGDKIRKRMEEENVSDIKDLKRKVTLSTLNTGSAKVPLKPSPTTTGSSLPTPAAAPRTRSTTTSREAQLSSNRAGPKPLSSILNLPLLYSAPHTTPAVSLLWSSYHLTHPTLAETFLSAAIPPRLYKAMTKMARECPNFVVPLLRGDAVAVRPGGEDEAFEMFYMQWLEHPTDGVSGQAITRTLNAVDSSEGDHVDGPLPMTSVIFTPLAEFKNNSEWAQPQLVLTHYPDLHNNPRNPPPTKPIDKSDPDVPPQHHPLVLLRGEISPSMSKSAISSPLPGQALSLSQAQAQLLALALQRFYCADVPVGGESDRQRKEREDRGRCLRGFGKDQDWDWKGLIRMSFGGVV